MLIKNEFTHAHKKKKKKKKVLFPFSDLDPTQIIDIKTRGERGLPLVASADMM